MRRSQQNQIAFNQQGGAAVGLEARLLRQGLGASRIYRGSLEGLFFVKVIFISLSVTV